MKDILSTPSRSMTLLYTSAAAFAAAAAFCYLMQRRRRRSRAPAPQSFPPPAIVISLARFPAKRASVLKRAGEAGLVDVFIFDAVDGKQLDASELRRRNVVPYANWRIEGSQFRFFNRDLKWGEVGCALSHVGVWRGVVAANTPMAIVLEDDVDFVPGFAELLRTALDEVHGLVAAGTLASEPDALYLGRNAMRPEHDRLLPRVAEVAGAASAGSSPAAASTRPAVRLVVPGFSYKTTAYLLWRRGAEKLLASGYEGNLIPVDDFLALTYAPHEAKAGAARPDLDALFASAPRLHMLAVRPSLCRERRGISATENSSLITEAAAAAAPNR